MVEHALRSLWCLAALVAIAGSAGAQRTWVVDAAGGPNHDFRDVPPALVAAAPGDRIVVRTGTYQTATTSKGVTLIGEAGAQFQLTLQGSGFRVVNLPAGQVFAIHGLATAPSSSTPSPAFEAVGCAGRIHFDRVQLTNLPRSFLFLGGSPAVRVQGCAAVTLTECALTGTPALDAVSSTVAIAGCRLTGNPAVALQEAMRPAGAGLAATSSAIVLARSTVVGGAGIEQGSLGFMPPAPGIEFNNSGMLLVGDPTDSVQAGPVTRQGAPALQASGGALVRDPSVALVPSGGAPPIGGSLSSHGIGRRPSLRVVGAGPGGQVRADLFAMAGDAAVLLAGIPAPPAATPFGLLWLDTSHLVPVQSTVVGTNEHWVVTLQVPGDPVLRGALLGWQAISGATSSAAWYLTNPAVIAIAD